MKDENGIEIVIGDMVGAWYPYEPYDTEYDMNLDYGSRSGKVIGFNGDLVSIVDFLDGERLTDSNGEPLDIRPEELKVYGRPPLESSAIIFQEDFIAELMKVI